jgi:hypothetical protein
LTGPNADELRKKRIVARLFKVLDHRIEITRGVHGERRPQSAADTERDMREVTSIMQVYARLVALDEQNAKQGSQDTAKGMSHDAEQLRRKLAGRLERLDRARDA